MNDLLILLLIFFLLFNQEYHCGSPIYGWSSIFYFTAMNASPDFAPRFAVYGDLGNINPQSMARLQEDTAQGLYDAILHVGDFAYDMNTVYKKK